MGTLVGEKIWGVPATDRSRQATVDGVNTGDLRGLVMTDQVGGTGHNIVGGNNIIFLGSLYQPTGEKQAVGKWPWNAFLTIGRIAREGQTRVPKAYILADKNFVGDQMVFAVKKWREQEEEKMAQAFTGEMLAELDSFEEWYLEASGNMGAVHMILDD